MCPVDVQYFILKFTSSLLTNYVRSGKCYKWSHKRHYFLSFATKMFTLHSLLTPPPPSKYSTHWFSAMVHIPIILPIQKLHTWSLYIQYTAFINAIIILIDQQQMLLVHDSAIALNSTILLFIIINIFINIIAHTVHTWFLDQLEAASGSTWHNAVI